MSITKQSTHSKTAFERYLNDNPPAEEAEKLRRAGRNPKYYGRYLRSERLNEFNKLYVQWITSQGYEAKIIRGAKRNIRVEARAT